jgi:hypothetical protein
LFYSIRGPASDETRSLPRAHLRRRADPAYHQPALFHAIQQHGRDERYNKRKKKYLYPGDDFKYWAMTTHEPSSRVLNRMKIEDDLPRLIADGQVEPPAPAPE